MHQPIRFDSRVDWWIPCLLFGGLAAGTAELLLRADRQWYDLIAMLLGWMLGISVFRQTYYELTNTTLHVRCGPFWRAIPLSEIRAATPTRNPLASMALSLDRIAIKTRQGRGVLISPRDKSGFLAALAQRADLE